MKTSDLPVAEQRRLAALHNLKILDTPSEERFDRVTRLARRIFDVPIALVSFVDENRQWFKSKQGLTVNETERHISFCTHAIMQDEVFVIPDAKLDPRFVDNPMVIGPPYIRFYAGQPIKTTDGYTVATLCIKDHKPRYFSQEELSALRELAIIVEQELDLTQTHVAQLQLAQTNERLQAELEARQVLEQSLIEYKARLSDAERVASFGVWSWQIDTDDVFWSENIYQVLGLTSDEDVSFAAYQALVHPEDLPELQQYFEQMMAGHIDEYRFEHRLIRSDGDLRMMLSVGGVEHDEQGQPSRLVGLVQDITERRKTKDALEAAMSRLQVIAEFSQQLNAVLDIDLLLTELLDRLKERLDYYHAHVYLVDRTTGNLVMMHGSGEVGRLLKARNHQLLSMQGIVGRVATTSTPFFSNDVSQDSMFVRNPLLPDTQSELAVPMLKDERVVGVLDVQSDKLNAFTPTDLSMLQSIANQAAIAIDNAQLLEERQQTIAQLRQLDQAKSQFITMMSHELRTPLNAINGFAEMMSLGMSGELPKQAQADAALIHKNGMHLLDLINDVLDISQIEAGQIKLIKRPVTLAILVTEALEQVDPFRQTREIDVNIDIEPATLAAYADPTRLKQILLNLLNNAIKFTPRGRVTVQARPTDMRMVRIAVIDTGIGIPTDKRLLIFDSFQQIDMSDSRQYGGTGLGLSICRQLVHLHGGSIGVNSEEGVGSEFWFTLPMAEAEEG